MPSGIGVEEHLGERAALDTEFLDETGSAVTLGSLVDRPTVIVPIYLNCKDVCPTLLSGVSEVLGKLGSDEDFRVLTISFDENDTPEIARTKKTKFLQTAGSSFPAERWSFLTGSQENIKLFMDSIGFSFERQPDGGFTHATLLVVLAPNDKIIRYMYGTQFLPFDLKMALTEASEGRVGSMGSKVVTYCFSSAPKGRTYVSNALKISGALTILFTGSLFSYLVITARNRRKHRDGTNA